jgi:glycosyltransferase involved in cell wall biosynthesis
MGEDYPIWSIPAPVYDANAPYATEAQGYQPETLLRLTGIVIDSAQVDLSVFSLHRSFSDGLDSLRALSLFLAEEKITTTLRVTGVVYTSVFNPIDGRKNFNDLLGGFIWAFRDVEDATLILKITHFDPVRAMLPLLADLAKHGRFRCRVLLVHGMLPDDEYRDLMRLTSYAVNTSTNEGQCLPLMEFMSAGRPAVAPLHSAMLDYVTPENTFIVHSAERLAVWPHDPRICYRSRRYLVSVADLVRAYRESYLVAKQDPDRYAAMSRAATASLHDFCATSIVHERLAEVLRARIGAARQTELTEAHFSEG